MHEKHMQSVVAHPSLEKQIGVPARGSSKTYFSHLKISNGLSVCCI